MKIRLLLLTLISVASLAFAQTQYPLVSIHDIQFIDSVGTKGFVNSPLLGDTVRVRGTIMIRPIVDPDTNRTPMMWYNARWGSYIQDSSDSWGGLNVLQDDTSSVYQGTFFDLADTSDYVEMTGVVTAYNQTNELMLLIKPTPVPVNYIAKLPKRPDPIQLYVTDFMNNQQSVLGAFKYSGMYVELHNLISANRNTTTGQFNAYDANGNYVVVYPQARYFRLDHKLPWSKFQPPADGTPINMIRGIISYYSGVYEIIPLYPNDIYITLTPPLISNLIRNPVQVNANQSVTITAKILGGSGYVKNAQLHYKVGTQSRTVISMTKSLSDTTQYSAVINGISADSTMVDYYITANDNLGLTGYTPSDTVKGNYFYQVLNEPLKIRDVQYSPFGSGYSSYNGYYVTISGIVTADTSDYAGLYSSNYPKRVYMQDGSGPWTGIMLGTLGMKGVDVLKLKSGDNITLTGKIVENYSVTAIDSLTNIVINSHNNALPASVTVPTGTIGRSYNSTVGAEQWESVLINYKNVTVVRENADGIPGPNVSSVNNNYGEMFVSDGKGGDSTRISLQDGNNNYENFWDANFANNPAKIRITTGSKFSELQGILYYSFSNYKLCPRKASDFIGFTPTDVKDIESSAPKTYSLEQNYPNPFNPSTIIKFSVPKENMVTLKIFNILGQEVKTLVNQEKLPGTYEVSFNANELSSGIYFYSLSSGNFYQVKKMMLLK